MVIDSAPLLESAGGAEADIAGYIRGSIFNTHISNIPNRKHTTLHTYYSAYLANKISLCHLVYIILQYLDYNQHLSKSDLSQTYRTWLAAQ